MTFNPDIQFETGPLRDTYESIRRLLSREPSIGGIQYRDVQLTDAQIKTLPTNTVAGVELVPAPGSGLAIMPMMAWLIAAMPSVAYGNIDANAVSIIQTANSGLVAITWLSVSVTQLLHFAGSNSAAMGVIETTGDGANQSAYDNQPLAFFINNGSSGSLTGGDAANTLSIRVWYAIVPVVPFGAIS